MCAVLARGYTFSSTETVTNTKLHSLVDSGTITGIVDADISAGAAIQFSKLLASSIDGSLLINLGNIVSGAGKIPFANLNVPFGSSYVSLVSIPATSILPITLASWIDGTALRNLASTPIDRQVRYNLIVSSLGSGSLPVYNGTNNFIGKTPTEIAPNQSNCLFQFLANTLNSGSGLGEIIGTSLTPTTATGNYRFLSNRGNQNTYLSVWGTKWKKISGVSTITIYAEIWGNSGTDNANLKVDIGGQNNNVSGTLGQASPEWVTMTIDVSSLTNDTVYTVDVQIEHTGQAGTFNSYIGNLIAFGS